MIGFVDKNDKEIYSVGCGCCSSEFTQDEYIQEIRKTLGQINEAIEIAIGRGVEQEKLERVKTLTTGAIGILCDDSKAWERDYLK